MNRCKLLVLLTCACIQLHAQVNNIYTIAGTGAHGYSGDDSVALSAKLYKPFRIYSDEMNNLFIADALNNRIRKIDAITSIITTIAGDGTAAFGGDGEQATHAKLNYPDAVIVDHLGNIYISDELNQRIRKIAASTGIINTIAGNGSAGYNGDNIPATDASLNRPAGLCFDSEGRLYIADWGNNRIRRVDLSTGVISTIGGNGIAGYSGDGNLATNATLNTPVQVFTDHEDNILIAEPMTATIRRITQSTGIINTIAGTGVAGYSGDNGLATDAKLDQPSGIYVDSQSNIFIAEFGNGTVRKINGATGIITTVAGTGVTGYCCDGGPATNAQMNNSDVLIDKNGHMVICDYDNHRIRRVGAPPDKTAIWPKAIVTKREVSVYPNPATNELTVANVAEASTYRLINAEGKCVQDGILKKGDSKVVVKGLPPGVYRLEAGGAVVNVQIR